MDGNRFDELARSLARGRTRRSLLRAGGLAAGAAVAATVVPDGAAAALRPGGAICRKPGDCVSGVCTPDATGRGRCACEEGATPCTPSTCCAAGQVCVDGVCRVPAPPDLQGTCPAGGDNCIFEVISACGGGLCRCYQRIGGAGTICSGDAVCQDCDEDADCGPGRYCITATPGGDCCEGLTTTICGSPCPT